MPETVVAPAVKHGKLFRMFAVVYSLLLCFVLSAIFLDAINALLVFVHLVVFLVVFDVIFYIIKRVRKKSFRFDFSFVSAIIATAVYLTVGYVLANTVSATRYALSTEKHVGDFRVVMFADSHVGTTFDGAELNRYVSRMNAYNPDVVIIAGDYVDDDTSLADMRDACRALGRLKTRFGVYFVFGNHDAGYYDNSKRGYDADDLARELENNGVSVIEDEAVLIDDRIYIVGRRDKSAESKGEKREDMKSLTFGLDKSKYIIVADHQPVDYEKQKNVVDLVLSGHTHGGQMFPIGLVSDMFGLNDLVYGHERRADTDFIVTSGISDWAFKFKIGCRSEFTVIDIREKT